MLKYSACGLIVCLIWLLTQTTLPASVESQEETNKNLVKLSTAMMDYVEKNKFRLPPASIASPAGQPLLSWRVAILPYLGESALYSEFKLDEPWNSPKNLRCIRKMPAVFRSIESQAQDKTFFKVVSCKDGSKSSTAFPLTKGLSLGAIAAKDGTDYTLGILESAPEVVWTKPEDIQFQAGAIKSQLKSPTGKPFVHAAMINYNITLKLNLKLSIDEYDQAVLYNDGKKLSKASLEK